jgi:2-polyprenyl-3-methyl-5-hydroxy-6-metoxy-1,4-benzoquinol methylase
MDGYMIQQIQLRAEYRPTMSLQSLDLKAFYVRKYGPESGVGPKPRRRLRFNYFAPDDHYEALVDQLVTPGCRWLDVGGGRNIFPENPALAHELAERAGHLTGVDPSTNIHDNPFVNERVQAYIEEYQANEPFDLLTLRMVAEHITNPHSAMQAMSRLVKPGGRLVVFTINKWSPVSVAAWLTPFRLHHPIKRVFWRTEEKDTFPVAYRMNTRPTLNQLASAHGFRENSFQYLDDLSTFARFEWMNYCELLTWKTLNTAGIRYPENCLLGVYERT